MDFRKLDLETVRDNLAYDYNADPEKFKARIGATQVMVYVMAGGGMIGRMHAEQPADAYVDSRASRRPYPLRAVAQATAVLKIMAEVAGLDPHAMPRMPDFHAAGCF